MPPCMPLACVSVGAGMMSALRGGAVNGKTCRMGCAQDEREMKRQRRKQSNRESARRSRLRKQAECETLATKVGGLEAENARLKEEVKMLQAQLEAALAAAKPAG